MSTQAASNGMRALRERIVGAMAYDVRELAKLGVPLSGITADSRAVTPGVVFAAFPGGVRDGREFIPQAIERGAAAVLWDATGFSWNDQWQVPHLPVAGLRDKLGAIASHLYGNPSQQLRVVGVTGTNGKTSCSHWVAQAFALLGHKTALLGTVGNGIYGALAPSTHTTPDAAGLQNMLAGYVSAGVSHVAMEVSSHGLDQGRVYGIQFGVALFTNLSHDHLDYHGDMAAYGAAKAKLFALPGLKSAVVNLDDPFGAELVGKLANAPLELLTYGMGHGAVAGRDLRLSETGLELHVDTHWGNARLMVPVLGRFNAHNVLGVLAVLLASGVALDEAVAVLSQLTPVAGRMRQLGGGELPLVVVDYAHTPDALEKVLQTLREMMLPGARLVCVFGCGGDRDRTKRPLMGAIAAKLADVTIVTSDNPRGEPPHRIVNEIVAGMLAAGAASHYETLVDRAQAIERAVELANPGDVVLVAGKGHETTQETGLIKLPFSDQEQVAAALERRQSGRQEGLARI